MSHDIAYTLQHPRLFLLLHCHHYPPSPLSTITTILLSAQQGTPQTDQRHFILNACADCDQCRPTLRIPHTTQWLFFSLRHYHHPPWCPTRHPPTRSMTF